MEWLKPTQTFVARWWAYIDWCTNAEMQAPICRPFWTWAMIAFLAIGALVGVWVAARIISYRIKLAAALRAEAERMRVADETIRASSWDEDKAYRTHEHTARKT